MKREVKTEELWVTVRVAMDPPWEIEMIGEKFCLHLCFHVFEERML